MDDRARRAALLAWYDRNARELPWRVVPAARAAGLRPDPYRVWLSEMMLQQTTVRAVVPRFVAFVRRWSQVAALAAASEEEVLAAWAGLGYYARARNLHRAARIVAERLGGCFPDTEAGLAELPGVGPYTAAAIAAIAFDRETTVVDGNVERVIARLHAVQAPLPGAKPQLRKLAAGLAPGARPGDLWQAVMDLGATVCTPQRPRCGICPLRSGCRARAEGLAAELPRRAPRRARPVRLGHAFVATRAGDGALLLARRPPRGLLGGTMGWPCSEWREETVPPAVPPLPGDWEEIGEVRHVFTHFALILRVHAGRVAGPAPEGMRFLARDAFDAGTLPSLMRKVWELAQGAIVPGA